MKLFALSPLILTSCLGVDWAGVGKGVVPDEVHLNSGYGWGDIENEANGATFPTDMTYVGGGLTWYVGPRESVEAAPRPWVIRTTDEPYETDKDGKPLTPALPGADVVVFTDPETGDTWVKPKWLYTGGFSLLVAAYAFWRKLHTTAPVVRETPTQDE